jgi:hypothetical protein
MGSRIFHKGVRCMGCYNSHTRKTRLPGNFLCLSCHGPGATNAPVINPGTQSQHKVFGYDTNGVLTNTDRTAYKPAQNHFRRKLPRWQIFALNRSSICHLLLSNFHLRIFPGVASANACRGEKRLFLAKVTINSRFSHSVVTGFGMN